MTVHGNLSVRDPFPHNSRELVHALTLELRLTPAGVAQAILVGETAVVEDVGS